MYYVFVYQSITTCAMRRALLAAFNVFARQIVNACMRGRLSMCVCAGDCQCPNFEVVYPRGGVENKSTVTVTVTVTVFEYSLCPRQNGLGKSST